MKLKWFLGAVLLFVLLFAFSSPVFAQTPPTVGANLNAYVPPAGAECNIDVPSQYPTIQAGIDAANWGDTVCVGPGTYNEDIEINKTITLSGSGASSTVINGQSSHRGVYVTAASVIVEGFFIRGAGISNVVQLNINDPTLTLGATVRYNWIKAGNYGIAVYIGGSQNLIQNNILEGNNSPYVARVGTNTNILNNTFIGTVNSYDANDTGLYVDAGANSVVRQNVFNPTSGFNDTLVSTNNSVVSENNFDGDNTPIKVAGYPAINAQNNWWGDTDPSDNIRGDIDYSNFTVAPFPEYPYNEPPLVRVLRNGTIVAGSTYTTSSYFLDTGSSSWTATVDYGDGSGAELLVLSDKTFSLNHVYQNTGTYTVTVSVTDDQNATGTETATITVSSSGITVGANLSTYVPPTGSECDINVPSQYSTIQAGVDAASQGDTVCVGPGIYNEDVRINKSIRLAGSGASRSVINAQADGPGAILVTTHNVIVEGFLLHGAGISYALQTAETVSGITLRNNWMVAGYGGILLWLGPATNNSLIQNNILEGNNSPYVINGGRTHKIVFLNNTFTGTVNSSGENTGIVVYMLDPSGLITQNAFHTTGTTLGLIKANVNSMVNGNNFGSDTLIKILGTSGPLIINAENNWWGDTDPSDNITNIVDYTPFASSPFPEYPYQIVGANLAAYQPPTGSECDINVPTQYSTIQVGIDAASSGDTVCVGPGTYNEDVEINKTIKLSGSGELQSTIVGQNPIGRGNAVLVRGTNVIVEGFLIRGAEISPAVVLNVNDPTLGAAIQYNRITAGNGGWVIYAGSSQNLIQNNILEGNSSPYVARVTTHTNILNNTFIGTVNSTDGNDQGFYLTAEANSSVKQNNFNPTSGLGDMLIGSNNSIITENNFHGDNTPIKVSGYPAINAQGNWWGDTDPSNNIRGDVDYSNFATAPFPEYPYNAAPIIRVLRGGTVVAGDTYTTSSYFLDTGSSSWTATVDYGDGSGIQPLVLSDKTFSLNHVYQNTGTYTVTVSITDDQNATGTETATITVRNAVITVGANLNAYTPPTGSECNINVPSQYPTIQAGIDAANAGDTVCVGPGTYNEDVRINKSIRLSGRGAPNSIINAQADWPGAVLITTNNVIVEGFLMHGAGNSDVLQTAETVFGITLRNNWMVAGYGGLVLWLGPATNNSLIHDNILEGNNSSSIINGGLTYRVSLLSNTFTGTANGVVVVMRDPRGLIRQNAFHTTGAVSELIKASVNSMINENNFDSSVPIMVLGNPEPLAINAENNWWGDTDPSDNISLDVDFTPFALSPFPEYSLNQPPIANAGSDQTSDEGSLVSFDGSLSSDPDGTGDIISYEWSFGDGGTGSGQTANHTYTDNGNYVATLTVTDSAGASSSDTAQITVSNVAPSVGTITAPSTPVEVNTAIPASASFTDPGILDTHTASWDWGDGNVTVGTVTESDGSGSVSDSHTYTAAGVYTITLTVTDNNGAVGTSTFQYVSVYNPTPQGLFTGNRIFSSPAGAYPQNPNLTGQVQFGVTSKYQDTSLIGQVSMNFRAANLEFDSTSLTVLVISDSQATLRGTGTVNGSGNYDLLVTGLDGPQDAIRIQIKDQSGTVIYDSQLGAADTATPTASVTGQIIVH